MPVSKPLEKSAKEFSDKYACKFDFATFESRVEEFTFLRPNNGWVDVYKTMFDRMYKKSLEKAAVGSVENLDCEAMLDDFEYTLIRPYVNESENVIKHKPYVGMDRIERLEYLEYLTSNAPSNPVDLYSEKYKTGELSIKQMWNNAKKTLSGDGAERGNYVEIAGYVQALENVNKKRSMIWRTFFPLKNSAEKRDAALMKKMLVEKTPGGEEFYEELAVAAHETFDGHKKVSANLAQSMVLAREEVSRKQKMNDAMRESLRIEGSEKEADREQSQRIDQYKIPICGNQNLI